MRRKVVARAAAAGVALSLSGAGVAAYAGREGDPSSAYRLVAATTGDVEETLATTGTVDASGRADVAFAVDGTVDRVRVRPGQKVKAGQVLATLEDADLKAAVTSAAAALARARAQLETDEDAQASDVSDAVSQTQPTTDTPSTQPSAQPSSQPSTQPSIQPSSEPTQPTSGPDSDAVTAAIEQALAELGDQQDAVVTAQHDVTSALADADDALAAQQEACESAFEPSTTADPSADPSDSSDPSASASADPSDDSSDADQACSDALATVQQEQADAADAEQVLAGALTDLTDTLAGALADIRQAASTHSSTPSTSPSTTPPASQPDSQPSQSSPQTPQSSASPSSPEATDGQDSSAASSAARLASDQAAIDQAEADLLQARTERGQARVVAPISGRVASVDVERGDSVAAADTAAVIVNGTGVVVETTVPETRIRQVKVGQAVHVTPVGSTASAAGRVTSIGLTADTSSGTATYAVTVSVPSPDVSLPTGSEAEVEVVTGEADDVVTVPASAVTRAGDAATVRVLGSDGNLTLQPVTLGLVGSRSVEISSGLKAGDRVILAVLGQEVTGAGTQTGMNGPMRIGPVDGTMGGPMQGGPPVIKQG